MEKEKDLVKLAEAVANLLQAKQEEEMKKRKALEEILGPVIKKYVREALESHKPNDGKIFVALRKLQEEVEELKNEVEDLKEIEVDVEGLENLPTVSAEELTLGMGDERILDRLTAIEAKLEMLNVDELVNKVRELEQKIEQISDVLDSLANLEIEIEPEEEPEEEVEMEVEEELPEKEVEAEVEMEAEEKEEEVEAGEEEKEEEEAPIVQEALSILNRYNRR